jgi:heme A synthase
MQRIISIGLFLTVLICYLEWAGGNSGFLFQMEYGIFLSDNNKDSFMHPLVFIPLFGQLLILISIFKPNPKLILTGIILLSILVLMILLVGILSLNLKIILSTLSFIGISVFFIFNYKKYKQVSTKN